MNVQLTGNQICQQNIQNANALLATSEGNIDVVLDNVSRIRDLTLQAKNGTYSDNELDAMQKEIDERIAEIDRVSASAKHSEIKLFGDENLKENGITFQVGQNADEAGKSDNVIKVDKGLFNGVEFSALTTYDTQSTTGVKFDLKTIKTGEAGTGYGTFDQALTKLDGAIDNLTNRKAMIGSAQSRLSSALDTLTTQYTNLSSANSIIKDADIAAEASKFTQNQILQQVSTSLLAQANQTPAIALSLI
jgi:flagellin